MPQIKSKNAERTLVYVDDVLMELMQYPNKQMSKSVVKSIIDSVVKEKAVKIEDLLENKQLTE